MPAIPRTLRDSDSDWVLALNQRHAVELSPLSRDGLARLVAAACYARVCDTEAAFLIAFDQDGDYDSPNFFWFRERYNRFLYVDRIAVAASARGRGLARLLYEDLFRYGAARGHDAVVCEVNSDPPNPHSDAFHESFGFAAVGAAHLADRGKSVRYLRRGLTDFALPGAPGH